MPVRVPDRPRPANREEALETQLKLARAQNAYLHRALATALQQGPLTPVEASTEEALRLEVTDLRQRLATLTLHYQDADRRLQWVQQDLAACHQALGWAPTAEGQQSLAILERQLDTLLRDLVTLAHPDKWSQGQPATALAHALTTTINAMRARLHAGPSAPGAA